MEFRRTPGLVMDLSKGRATAWLSIDQKLRRMAGWHVRGHDQDEVVQECLFRLIRKLKAQEVVVKKKGVFSALLRRMVFNVACELGRKKRPFQELEVEPASAPDTSLLDRKVQQAFSDFMLGLPVIEQNVFGKKNCGWPQVDIARELGISEARVSRMVSRLRKNLERHLYVRTGFTGSTGF